MDLISRQAAIDALKIAELGCDVEAIEALPSAEPVMRCAECIHWDRDGEEDVDGEKLCHFFSEGNEEFEFTVASDDYCSFAERRIDESD